MAVERIAVLKSNNKQIKVYRSKERGTWISSSDFETEYTEDELNFQE